VNCFPRIASSFWPPTVYGSSSPIRTQSTLWPVPLCPRTRALLWSRRRRVAGKRRRKSLMTSRVWWCFSWGNEEHLPVVMPFLLLHGPRYRAMISAAFPLCMYGHRVMHVSGGSSYVQVNGRFTVVQTLVSYLISELFVRTSFARSHVASIMKANKNCRRIATCNPLVARAR